MYCSQCGAPNSPERLFCSRCNAPLVNDASNDESLPPWLQQLDDAAFSPQSSDQPLDAPAWLDTAASQSAPATASEAVAGSVQPAEELPDWLRDLQASTPPPSSHSIAEHVATPADSSPLPPWLAELQQSHAPTEADHRESASRQETADDIPPWLHDDSPAQPAPPAAQTTADAVPDWMRDLEQPAASAAASQAADIPDWLQDLEQPAAPAAQAAENPDWLQEPEQSTQPFQPDQADVGDAIPPWLHDDSPAQPAPPAAQTTADAVPDWMRDLEQPAASAAAPQAADIPDWLQDLEQPAAPATQAAENPDWLQEPEQSTQPFQPDQADVGDDIPPWLRDDSPAQTAPAPAEVDDAVPDWLRDLEQPTAPAPATQAADSPDWLQEPEQSTQPFQPDQADVGDDIPPWLRDDSPAQPTPSTAQTTADAVPDWMRDLEQPAQPSQPDQADVGDDIPPWLRESEQPTTAAPTAQTADSADWLHDLEQSTQPFQPDQADVGDDIPDWLHDDSPAQPAPPAAQTTADAVPDWMRDLEQPTQPSQPDQADVGDDIPDWLRDEQPAQPAPPAAQTADAVPDWMRDLEQPAAPATQAADSPDWLHDLEQPTQPLQPDQVDDGDDIPPWLRKLEPQTDLNQQTSSPDTHVEADSIQAHQQPKPSTGDLPSWLKDLDSTPPIVEVSDEEINQAEIESTEKWEAHVDQPAAAAADTDVPEWLRIADSSEPVVAPNHDPDIAGWLIPEEQPGVTGSTTAINNSTSDSNVPAWLRDVDEEIVPADSPPISADAHISEDIPAWMEQDEAPAQTPAASDFPAWLQEPEVPTGDSTVPTWITEDEPALSEASAVESDNIAGPETDAGNADIPAWLQEDTDEPAPATTIRLEPAVTEAKSTQQPESTVAEVPAWLIEDEAIQPVTTPSWLLEPDPVTEEASTDATLLSNVDLPAWLRHSVTEQLPQQSEPEQDKSGSPDWLRVLGTNEPVTQADGAVATIKHAAIAPPLPHEPSSERLAAAALLRDIIAQPIVEPVVESHEVSKPWWKKPGINLILALLLLLAILVPFFVPNLPLPVSTPVDSNAAQIVTYINDLNNESFIDPTNPSVPVGSRVIIAYEADLRRSAEIKPLEEAVVTHLVEQDIPVILLSTDIEGDLMAAQRGIELLEAGVPGGSKYIYLSYLPGGKEALARFATNPRAVIQEQTAENIDYLEIFSKVTGTGESIRYESPIIGSIRDISLLVILADSPEDVQNWIDQVWSVDQTMPILVLTTNESAVLNLPYLEVEGDLYQLTGLEGLQNYQAARGQLPTAQGPRTALTLSSIVIIIVIVVGSISETRRRRQVQQREQS